MREIGAFEAKNKFGQLLDWVERGEEVTITRAWTDTLNLADHLLSPIDAAADLL